MHTHNTPNFDAESIPIFRGDGRIVGEVIGDCFHKRVKSAHFLQRPRALASDVDVLRQAQDAGAEFFCAHHLETGQEYRAPIARFFSRGLRINRGHSPQIALLLSDFNVPDHAPTPTNKASQLPLFDLSPRYF